MRTEVREYNIYPIGELSQKSQETAHHDWLSHKEYLYVEDNRKTMEKFEELFNLNISNWSYDNCTYNYSFYTNLSGNIEELKGVRLATYITNNHWSKLFKAKTYSKGNSKRKSRLFTDNDCPLTGYYTDDDILKPIYDFLQRPNNSTTYLELMDKCLDSFFKSCKNDVEYTESEEYFKEDSISNEMEYLENGTLFN